VGSPPPPYVVTPEDTTRTTPAAIPLPAGREITFFVIFAFVALLALLASSIWAELRARYR
jgi:hypothetical protein